MNPTKCIVASLTWTAAVLLTFSAGIAAAAPYAYVRSSIGEPWDRTDNITAMNSLFGAPNVETLLYESLNIGDLFTSGREMIFMTGGENSSVALGNFLTANKPAMESWVAGGGSLVIAAAETSGGLLDMGFGATWVNLARAGGPSRDPGGGDGLVTDASHPVFAGTGLSNGDLVDGNDLHHSSLTGSGFTTLMTTTLMTAASGGNPILMERDWGNGYVMLGTLTLNFFGSSPFWDQPESQLILENILSYAATQSAIPEPSTLLLGALASVGLLMRWRRLS